MKQVVFKGSGNEYVNIWIVNILLCIVTLGIYYPWAKVRTRRYFYANTIYEGRNFEYHATGKQLFMGYLIGVGILFLYTIINQVLPLIGMFLPILLFVFVPWIIWRSLKFNARMTSFSNVRFSFDGGLKQSYIVYLVLPLLGYLLFASQIVSVFLPSIFDGIDNVYILTVISILTVIVGLLIYAFLIYLFGAIQKKGIEYKIGRLKFGQDHFLVNITAGFFIKILFKTGLLVLGFFLVFAAVFAVVMFMIDTDNASAASDIIGLMVMLFILLAYLAFIAAPLFVRAYYYSRYRQYIYANTRFDKTVKFESTVRARPYFWVLFTNMLMTLFTLGLARPWAKVREMRYIADNTWIDSTQTDLDNYLTQKQEEQSAIGEEIGDVLDIDVGIGL